MSVNILCPLTFSCWIIINAIENQIKIHWCFFWSVQTFTYRAINLELRRFRLQNFQHLSVTSYFNSLNKNTSCGNTFPYDSKSCFKPRCINVNCQMKLIWSTWYTLDLVNFLDHTMVVTLLLTLNIPRTTFSTFFWCFHL